MSIDKTLRQLVTVDGLDPEVAADKALASVSRKDLIDYVRPLVLLRARGHARSDVRRIENRAFTAATPDALPTTAEARAALVQRSFPVPGKGMVPWTEATMDDHLARAAWQRNQSALCVVDAERHEAAADLISQHGVTTLGQIEGWTDLLGDQP